MKKVLLLLVVVSLVVLASCKKDKDDPTYTKSQFVGITWVLSSSTANDSTYIKFSDTQFFEEYSYADLLTAQGINYTFDGKSMSLTESGLTVKYTISSITATQLVLSYSWNGVGLTTETYKKK